MPGYPPMCRVLEVTQPLPSDSHTSVLVPSALRGPAPKSLDRAYKVAGRTLAFLMEAAEQTAAGPYQTVSVTVPASFHLNQRRDTL